MREFLTHKLGKKRNFSCGEMTLRLTWNADPGLLVHLVAGRAGAGAGQGVEDQPAGAVAHAAAGDGVHHEAELAAAGDADAVLVEAVAGRADALLPLVQDQAAARRAGLDRGALDRGVALVPIKADAGHGADREGVQHGALGVGPAGPAQQAGVHALLLDAGGAARAVAVLRAGILD